MGASGSWTTCASDADCPGTDNACVTFLAPPQPIAQTTSSLPLCLMQDIPEEITGTVNTDTGAAAFTISIRSRIFAAAGETCPSCVAGTCDSGARTGQPCTVHAASTSSAELVSHDCPPAASTLVATNNVVRFPLTTGSSALTITAASPQCRFPGVTDLRCACDTCDNAAGTPCASNADCAAVGATTCGGKRCVAGTNVGAPCTVNSECPSGACQIPGAATRPNFCGNEICSSDPSDSGSAAEGTCALEGWCIVDSETPCFDDEDCAPGDACDRVMVDCFLDNGVIGGQIAAAGVASTTSPTLAGVACLGRATQGGQGPAANMMYGLPGPARYTLPGTALFY